MKIKGKSYQTIWLHPTNNKIVQIIDQRWLPHQFVIEDISSSRQMGIAIKDMHLRGAPCIGAAAAYGMYLAAMEAPQDDFQNYLQKQAKYLNQTRPTAVDLGNAIQAIKVKLKDCPDQSTAVNICLNYAKTACAESVEHCRLIGQYGLELIQAIAKEKGGEPVNILTHCNAGWLATVDYGTATSPIYAAHDAGIPVHVWVDETRPRNQGARITAFELLEHGVPHTVIPDNVGGHLMQHSMVDLVIVGSDRTTRTGDVANKVGTYLKALAAKDNKVPFYVTLPHSSFDFTIRDGLNEIPIEKRGAREVSYIQGKAKDGSIVEVLLMPENSPALNYAFDVTPARLVTGLITERGICAANENAILNLFPEYR
ncbi:MAG: S-methyl-5-thioribose-1-phosphate isomerase [Bacteroidota bacterium]